jgi:putative NADH-flavin reductase
MLGLQPSLTGVAPMPTTIPEDTPMRVLLLGGTGTAGQGAARALVAAGHDVTCVLRSEAARRGPAAPGREDRGDVTDAHAMAEVLTPGRFDAVVSCLASRSGAPKDAWAIDHDAQVVRWRRRGRRRRAVRAALGDLRAEAASGVPVCETGLRGAVAARRA